MSHDDHVPDDDAIADRARHALRQIAGMRTIDSSWGDVQTDARRVRQRRLSMLGAAGAIVLIAGTAAVAAVGRDDTHPTKRVGSESPATSISQTTTSVPLAFGSSSAAPTLHTPIAAPETAVPTAPTGDTQPGVLQPQDGRWDASASTDSAQVTVGDTVTVRAELRNTGTEPQSTIGYGSLGIACDRWPIDAPPTDGLPLGQFLDWVVLQPGESRSFSMSFQAEPQFVGSIICGVGLAFHGDAYAAGPYDYPSGTVTIDIVAPTDTTTATTTDTVPTTETTVP